ncbi:hypothetical protein NVP1031O_093 [Vibrio phage 1.031.O._10N.261.46.F8]|nr:hypothetical protein NVP1031O_093 [Vibrio phage 1.031.O._10N.261.46.F8]
MASKKKRISAAERARRASQSSESTGRVSRHLTEEEYRRKQELDQKRSCTCPDVTYGYCPNCGKSSALLARERRVLGGGGVVHVTTEPFSIKV